MRKISLKYQFLCSLLHLSRRALNYLSTQYNYQFTRGLESRIKMIDQHHSIWKTTNWTKIKDYNFWSVFGAKIELLCLRFQGWVRLIELGLDKFKMVLNFRTKNTLSEQCGKKISFEFYCKKINLHFKEDKWGKKVYHRRPQVSHIFSRIVYCVVYTSMY